MELRLKDSFFIITVSILLLLYLYKLLLKKNITIFKTIKIDDHFFIFTGIIILLITFILSSKSKLTLYTNYNYINKSSQQIISPIENVQSEDIEDTYGAPRPNGRVHEGIDIFAPYGAPIHNVIDGTIIYKGRDNLGGNVIKILGEDNRIYYYAHLSGYGKIEQGKDVIKNQVIGFIGKSGNAHATPPHLHFEIMEIHWLFPLSFGTINPYPELIEAIDSKIVKYVN
ncbi:MAG: M23 family metallopeptidase [Candidatus Marinimicrobia bacterium]|nr:M23 family metallopeptidase [Candidatus Neomarinimicrobiota bacterium]